MSNRYYLTDSDLELQRRLNRRVSEHTTAPPVVIRRRNIASDNISAASAYNADFCCRGIESDGQRYVEVYDGSNPYYAGSTRSTQRFANTRITLPANVSGAVWAGVGGYDFADNGRIVFFPDNYPVVNNTMFYRYYLLAEITNTEDAFEVRQIWQSGSIDDAWRDYSRSGYFRIDAFVTLSSGAYSLALTVNTGKIVRFSGYWESIASQSVQLPQEQENLYLLYRRSYPDAVYRVAAGTIRFYPTSRPGNHEYELARIARITKTAHGYDIEQYHCGDWIVDRTGVSPYRWFNVHMVSSLTETASGGDITLTETASGIAVGYYGRTDNVAGWLVLEIDNTIINVADYTSSNTQSLYLYLVCTYNPSTQTYTASIMDRIPAENIYTWSRSLAYNQGGTAIVYSPDVTSDYIYIRDRWQ